MLAAWSEMAEAADACWWLTKQGLPADAAYNLSWGRAITFDELVQAVKTSLPELTLEIKPGTPPISRMTALDTRRAKEELGWEPAYTLEESLAAYASEFSGFIG